MKVAPRSACRALPIVLAVVAGCHPTGTPLRADRVCGAEVCVSLREIAPSSLFKIVADIQAPPQALLRNAALKLASTVGEACQVGVPVTAVTLDEAGLPEGPAAIGGAHRLTLAFASDAPAEPSSTTRRVVDLDLAVGGQARCLSVPATLLGSPP